MNHEITVLTDKIGSENAKKRKIFCCVGFFSYLCSVQWNEGLAKGPSFSILIAGTNPNNPQCPGKVLRDIFEYDRKRNH